MKVLLLTTHLNTGGITSYLLSLAGGLISQGHQVFIVSSEGTCVEQFTSIGAKVMRIDIRTKSELSPKIYLNVSKVRNFITKHSIDIIHAHTRVTQVMAHFLSKRCGIPYLSTCHGFFKPRFSRKIFPCWGQATIAISQPVKQHLVRDFGIKENVVHVVNNGIDLKLFRVDVAEIKQELREQFQLNDKIVIGTIARLSDVKGLDVLIEAFRDVVGNDPRCQLVIIGQGKEEAGLKKLVNDLSLNDRVLFLPVIEQTHRMLPLIDLFVMPSRMEGLGLSVMEAQAVGLPVIASNV
ncbi:MAG: glycosyltransferase family 4 protein, partial [Candidatus Omnitrophica bacterium]|nr:glycosyltransferase family 4 protein [Candidatus Omnitrophota bacterium]